MTMTAGRLSGVLLGTVIRIRVGDATVIEDVIDGLLVEGDYTHIRFRNVRPSGMDLMLNSLGGGSFRLMHEDEIEVVQ